MSIYGHAFSFLAADLAAIKQGRDSKPIKTTLGQLLPNTVVQFEKAESSSLNLVGKAKGYNKFSFSPHPYLIQTIYLPCFRKQVRQSIINPDWDFKKMGIGGLDNEFNAIFRRAFASRVFPPEIIEQLGKHLHTFNGTG